MKRIIDKINKNQPFSMNEINYLIHNYSLTKIFSNLRVDLSDDILDFILTNYLNIIENYPEDLLFRGIYCKIHKQKMSYKMPQLRNSIDYISKVLCMELKDFVNLYIEKNNYVYNANDAIELFTLFYSILTEENKNKLYDIILFKDIKKLLEKTNKNNDFNLAICCKERPEIEKFISEERYIYVDCINDESFLGKYTINEILYLLEKTIDLTAYIDKSEKIKTFDTQYIIEQVVGKDEIIDVSEEYNKFLSLIFESLDINKMAKYLLTKCGYYGNKFCNFLNLFKNIFDEKTEKKLLKKLTNKSNFITKSTIENIFHNYKCKYADNQEYLNSIYFLHRLS
jgi:hypothetical protein